MPFGKRQQALIDEYVKELRAVKPEVNQWWAKLVAEARSQAPNEAAAVALLKARWPDGPAVHPRIVAIIRKYYLALQELNQILWAELKKGPEQVTDVVARPSSDDKSEEIVEGPIAPGDVLCEGLMTDSTKDLVAIPAKYSYWPIGMDEREWRASSPS